VLHAVPHDLRFAPAQAFSRRIFPNQNPDAAKVRRIGWRKAQVMSHFENFTGKNSRVTKKEIIYPCLV
jgi:hypothetical protein